MLAKENGILNKESYDIERHTREELTDSVKLPECSTPLDRVEGVDYLSHHCEGRVDWLSYSSEVKMLSCRKGPQTLSCLVS